MTNRLENEKTQRSWLAFLSFDFDNWIKTASEISAGFTGLKRKAPPTCAPPPPWVHHKSLSWYNLFMIFSTLFTGNLHLNITTPDHSDEVLHEIEPYVFEWTGLAIFYLQFRLCFITY